MKVNITQFMRPDGRRVQRTVEVPDELKEQYELLLSCGCELTCEQLMSHRAVQYISNDNGDFATVTTPAGDLEAARLALLQMIKAFDKDAFEKWSAGEMGFTDGKVGLTDAEAAAALGPTDEELEASTVKLSPDHLPLGPTGNFPDGKCTPDDRGELALAIAIDPKNKLIVMNFGIPVTFIGMEAKQAIAMADDLLRKIAILIGDENVIKRL